MNKKSEIKYKIKIKWEIFIRKRVRVYNVMNNCDP